MGITMTSDSLEQDNRAGDWLPRSSRFQDNRMRIGKGLV